MGLILALDAVYCKNYEVAVRTLVQCREDEQFQQFLKQQESCPEAKGLDLGAFLIMPIQVRLL